MNWDFLKSTRWWGAVIGAIAVYLQTKGYIGDPEMLLITTIMGAHIVIRTVDKFGENLGQ